VPAGWSYRAVVVFPWWLVLHFIEKGSGPQPSLINAALPLHTQVHVLDVSFHIIACRQAPGNLRRYGLISI